MSVFQFLYDFFTVDVYNFMVDSFAFFILKWSAFKLQIQLAALQFSWDVASSIIADLQITQKVNEKLNILPSDIVDKLHFFNITSGLNLMINAFMTRYVMGFIKI